MHGDISRLTFDPAKGYSSVREQQGRLRIDADQNEQTDILLHDARAARVDIIGASGAPVHDSGMSITSSGAGLRISTGRYYVDGIRCEARATEGSSIDFAAQPYLPGATLPAGDGVYLAVLDVWERPVTAIQDPSIREVALSGPDTATRTQVVWQVRLVAIAAPGATPSCGSQYPEWQALNTGSTGTLEVRVTPAAANADPCVVSEEAGFRGLENQLYRIEIHDLHPTQGARFKWSRDNGSVVAAVLAHPSANKIDVDRLGPGGANGFDLGGWVELTDDHDQLLRRPGRLAQINDIEERVRLVLGQLDGAYAFAADRHPQVRRWDSDGVRATAGSWLPLEHGLEVRFSSGSYQPGDTWLVPARTALLPGTLDRQIEWPRVAGGQPAALPPLEPRHHYAKLALLQRNAAAWTVLGDCRQHFAALTDLVSLESRGGDGQEARPGHFLPAPIVVGVSRGRHPVANARLRFTLVAAETAGVRGALTASRPDATGIGNTASTVDVLTDASGLARVWWRLGPGPAAEPPNDIYQPDLAQEVEVRLLADDGTPRHLPLRFVALAKDEVILVATGGDAQVGRPGQTLPIALRARVSHGGRPLPGAQVRFVVLDTVFNGQSLNELTGGSIHASANVVSFVRWPGGMRMQQAIVATDAAGVAQVQWILGTDTRLPTRRVSATLLDPAQVDTAQSTLFSAHLALVQPLFISASVLPLDLLLLPEGREVALRTFEGLLFALPEGIQLGRDVQLVVEALLPFSYAATGLRPVPFGSGSPMLRTVLAGERSVEGQNVVWRLNAIERETLSRASNARSSADRVPICVRFEPVAGAMGDVTPWVRNFFLFERPGI